jgi:hypothetical protein
MPREQIMSGTVWSEDDIAIIRSVAGLKQNDPEFIAAAAKVGRSLASVRCKLRVLGVRDMNRTYAPPPKVEPPHVKRSDVLEMKVAALEQELARTAVVSDRVNVTTRADESLTAEQLWDSAERDSLLRLKDAFEKHRFEAVLPDKPCGIAFVSDLHIAPGTPCDFTRMREDARLIAATPGLYCVLGGDYVDNHIKHRAAIMAARSQPGDQWHLFNYYLSILAHKVIAMISGNHDDWTNSIGGIDMLHVIAKQQRLAYAPDEARIAIRCGAQNYKVAVRHQFRLNSSFNQTHSPKQWFRNGTEDFDIGVVCHHHEPASEHCILHGQKRWVARPGAYQYTSAYSRQLGYNPSLPTCPTAIIFPHERRIVGFDDVRDAALMLRGLQ